MVCRSVRETFNEGKNDRFVALNAGEHQDEVMSYLGRDQLPYFHALADRFTVERKRSSVASATPSPFPASPIR